jgi:hypothetical protein
MQSMSIRKPISRNWKGIIMGDMEFIKLSTGERTRFMRDGSVVKDQVDPPKIEWCDRCETFKRFDGGRYDFVMGSAELWYCELCK